MVMWFDELVVLQDNKISMSERGPFCKKKYIYSFMKWKILKSLNLF